MPQPDVNGLGLRVPCSTTEPHVTSQAVASTIKPTEDHAVSQAQVVQLTVRVSATGD
jgi:hypothetical protein